LLRQDRVVGALEPNEGQNDTCKPQPTLHSFSSNLVASAMFNGYVSTIVPRVDIGGDARAINPKLPAAGPMQDFGDAVLDAVPGLTFLPGKTRDPGACTVNRSGYVIVLGVSIRR
jgi:hypothetical protein